MPHFDERLRGEAKIRRMYEESAVVPPMNVEVVCMT